MGDDGIPDEIKNATLDNIFSDDDIVDLSLGFDQSSEQYDDVPIQDSADQQQQKNDALVIIGRKSRVQLCIFMIEMTLNHFRTITKTRNNVRALRKKINEIKGNPMPTYHDRDRGRRKYNKYNKYENKRYYGDEQKDSSPQYRKYDNNRGSGRGRGRARRYQQRPRQYQSHRRSQYNNGYQNNQENQEYNQQYDQEYQQQQYDQNQEQYNQNQQYNDDNNKEQYNDNNEAPSNQNKKKKRSNHRKKKKN